MRRVLASASPRRKEILQTLGIGFDVVPSAVDEPLIAGLSPEALARHHAVAKAKDVANRERGYVLGADTVVVVDGDVLGKPVDEAEAAQMITRLAGRWHEVITGVALVWSDRVEELSVTTRVQFRALDDGTVRRYAATGEGADKAGAYAVQGMGAGLVERIDGSYSNVVGLPAAETVRLLERAGALSEWP